MNGIDPKNLTAQLSYIAEGSPPSTHPSSAISNAFPGLEMDIRNLWRRIFEGIELHEATNLVASVDSPDPAFDPIRAGDFLLIAVEDQPVTVPVFGPRDPGGPVIPLTDNNGSNDTALEWSNALAALLHTQAGSMVRCRFRPVLGGTDVELQLRLRPVFEAGQAVISDALAFPGELTQSLCSPWQNDYRECACFYWAASRPDYVNVEPGSNGASQGQNWMQRDRENNSVPVYIIDDREDPRLISYQDLFWEWEKHLHFVLEGRDSE